MSETRLKGGDVTDTLIRATEVAAEMNATDVFVVLYARPPEPEVCRLRWVSSQNLTLETLNWLADKVKLFLLREPFDDEDKS